MKHGIAILTSILALSAQAQTATTSTWQKIGGDDVKTVYADPATYSSKGTIATIWVLEDLAKPGTNASGQAYQSVKKQMDIDCPERTFAAKYRIFHASAMGNGNVVSEGVGVPKTSPVAPGTTMESVFKLVCR